MTELERCFLAILAQHRGLANAISVEQMAQQLGLEGDTRRAQLIKHRLVTLHHEMIGSSCGKVHGWYQPVTQEEIEATTQQYRNRIKSLAILIAGTESAAVLAGVMRQMALEFEQETR